MSSTSSKKIWTNSRATTARRCLREHKLRYEDGWRIRPTDEADALHMGSACHRGLEAWWTEPVDLTKDILLGRVLSSMREPKNRARTELEQIRSEEWVRAYHEKWYDQRFNWKVVSVEWEWFCDMPNPDSKGVSQTWMLGGKFDVLCEYVGESNGTYTQGRCYNMEHKTTSEPIDDQSEYWARKLMDSQVSQYEVGALSHNIDLDGTVMDVGRKCAIRPLSKIKNIRQKKTETNEEFEERCRVEAPPETMDQFRIRLREKYAEIDNFVRRTILRSASDLEEWLRDTWTHSTFIRNATRQNLAPRNPDACMSMGRCPFFEHCAYGTALEGDARFIRDEWPHPELRKPE